MKFTLAPGWTISSVVPSLVLRSEETALSVSLPEDASKRVVHLLLDGWATGQDPALEPLRTQLTARGVLRSHVSAVRASLSRQAEYWRALTDEPAQAIARVDGATVSIVGVGGIGSVVLQHLVGAGVSRYRLLDADRVESSNLNRQFIFSSAQIGTLKVNAAREFILDRDPSARVEMVAEQWDRTSARQRALLFQDVDFVVSAIDNPSIESAIDVLDASWGESVPSILATAGLRRALVSPVFERGRSPREPRQVLRTAEHPSGGLLASHGPVNSLPGILAADHALHHLAGLHDSVEYTSATVVRWNPPSALSAVRVEAAHL